VTPSIIHDKQQGPRDALRPLANGKLVELGKFVLGLTVTILVAYFTAMQTIEQRVTRVETKEETHFQEVLRQLDRIETELIRLRSIR
jgi:hypothetical protein